jgi:type VI secretion system protein ImpF
MANPLIERIQPCLLDRLTDESPAIKNESRNERIISVRRYRDGVLRDLIWLLNTKSHIESDGLGEFPEAAASVLNYGSRDLSGLISSSLDTGELEHDVAEAIRCFEPRINPRTIEVSVMTGSARSPNGLALQIRGELWAHPIAEELFMRTELDLDTGTFTV